MNEYGISLIDGKSETVEVKVKAQNYSYVLQEGLYYFVDENGGKVASFPAMRVIYIKRLK